MDCQSMDVLYNHFVILCIMNAIVSGDNADFLGIFYSIIISAPLHTSPDMALFQCEVFEFAANEFRNCCRIYVNEQSILHANFLISVKIATTSSRLINNPTSTAEVITK